MESIHEKESTWWNLCRRAWSEKDPVRFLEVTMQIMRFLGRKQQRLDDEFDEAERARQADRKNGVKSTFKNTIN
jgi:hypothetical protein